jgi:hypothetical protein
VSFIFTHIRVKITLVCVWKPHSACGNRLFHADINLVLVEITLVRVVITLVSVIITRECHNHPHSCQNHTMRVEITIVRVKITVVSVVIIFVPDKIRMRVKITLCLYKSHS